MQSAGNRLQHTGGVAQDVVVPESQDAIVVIAQPTITDLIAPVFGVLTSVNFDDQAPLTAHEIDNVVAYWLLPNELTSFDSA